MYHDGSYSGKRPQLLAVQIALFSDEHPDKCPAPESDAPSRCSAIGRAAKRWRPSTAGRQPWSHHNAEQTFALDRKEERNRAGWVDDVMVKPCNFFICFFICIYILPYQTMEQGICYVIITVLVGYIGCMGLSNLDVFKCQTMYLARKVGTVLSWFSTDATTVGLKVDLEKQVHDETAAKVRAWLLLMDRLDYTTNISRTKKKLLQGTNKTTRISAVRIWKKWRST